MKLKRYVSALGVAGLSVGAMASSLAPAHADTNQLVNKIIGVGSDTTYELMADVDDVYNRSEGCNVAVTSGTQPTNNQCIRPNGTAWQLSDFTPNMLLGDADHDIAYSLYPVGSSNGIKTLDADNRTGSQALAGVAKNNYARSSRARRPPPGPPTPDPTTLRFTAIGRENLPWSVFEAQGLPTNLTVAQVTNIYRGCNLDGGGNPIDPGTWINNWNEVGGPNRPIVLYTAQAGSGTRSQWDTFMGGSSDKCIPLANKPGGGGPSHVIFENAPAPIINNGDVAGAMFYYSQGRFTENSESTKTPPRMFLGDVNGIAPTLANAADGSFPFSRFIWNVWRRTYSVNNISNSTMDYIGVKNDGTPGFLCRPGTTSGTNPLTGKKYSAEISDVFAAHGFARLNLGNTDLDGDLGIPGQTLCRVEN